MSSDCRTMDVACERRRISGCHLEYVCVRRLQWTRQHEKSEQTKKFNEFAFYFTVALLSAFPRKAFHGDDDQLLPRDVHGV